VIIKKTFLNFLIIINYFSVNHSSLFPDKNIYFLNRFCKPIMTKPKPAKPAAPQAPPSPASSGSEQQQPQADENANTNENTGDDANQASSTSTEPMETDKPDNAGSA
jgi:heat shock protein 4